MIYTIKKFSKKGIALEATNVMLVAQPVLSGKENLCVASCALSNN